MDPDNRDLEAAEAVSPAAKLQELRRAVRDCRRRGLLHSAAWAAEHAVALHALLPAGARPAPEAEPPDDDTVSLAKTFFDLKEYLRAAHALRARGGGGTHAAVVVAATPEPVLSRAWTATTRASCAAMRCTWLVRSARARSWWRWRGPW